MPAAAPRFPGKGAAVLALGLALSSGGCNALIGLTGYSAPPDAGILPNDAAARPDSSLAAVDASCDGDSSGPCYTCSPVTTPQFLNACTSATCVPFDDVGRLTNLLPDGSLPPLPSIPEDGGDD